MEMRLGIFRACMKSSPSLWHAPLGILYELQKVQLLEVRLLGWYIVTSSVCAAGYLKMCRVGLCEHVRGF